LIFENIYIRYNHIKLKQKSKLMNIVILIPNEWLTPLGLAEHLQKDLVEIGSVAKAALLHALSQQIDEGDMAKVALSPPPTQGIQHRISISLPSGVTSILKGIADSHGLTPGPAAKRMLGLIALGQLSGAKLATNSEPEVAPNHPVAVLNKLMGLEPRFAQAQLYDNLWDAISTGNIGMIEGGTGIGKTRAMMASACRWIQERKANVAICAPTIALLRQFVAEHQRQSEYVDLPGVRLVIGRREFVSEFDLLEFLQTRGARWDRPEIREWMLCGNAPNEDTIIDTAWQAHSLLQVAPDLPIDECRLDEICSAEDRGFKAYKAQFMKSHEARDSHEKPCAPEIILCTHAMLAQNMRRKLISASKDDEYKAINALYIEALRDLKGKKIKDHEEEFESLSILESELGTALNVASDQSAILPAFSCLIVDEGHTLEESFSSATSEYLSVRSLINDLAAFKKLGGRLPPKGLEIAESAISQLIQKAPGVDRRDFVALAGSGDSALIANLQAISSVCNAIGGVRTEASEKKRLHLKIKRAAILLDAATDLQRAMKYSFLRHSPIKHLPQLMVSNANVQTILSRLWSGLESAALVSATLYINSAAGPSSTFMASLLRVPLDRNRSYAPVHAGWTTSCVEGVWIPQETTSQRLLPPSRNLPGARIKRTQEEHQEAESIWHGEVAEDVEKIWRTSAGGVMVLCTSYATVNAVHEILKEKNQSLSPALVRANPTSSVGTQSQEFMTKSHHGLKPLWLAVGAAWAGVDTGGHEPWANLFGESLPASTDNVLTDLVIPRLPYGTNQSLTHLWRMRNNPNVPWEMFDASMRFKQALGRLVRRAGLPKNRRIFVLDARMGDPSMASRLTPFLSSLGKYVRRIYAGDESTDKSH
jgi:CRISPR type IV-associated DEAD/DEAH-box helicase Csf4